MALWLAFAFMSVVTASSQVSCSSPTAQAGLSLMQSQRLTEPAKTVTEEASIHPHIGNNSQGRVAASTLAKQNQSSRFSRLVLRPGMLNQRFCRSHPCSLLEVGSKPHNLGKTADLDESGYRIVAKLKDDTEMKAFIQRVIDDYDCRVKNNNGLMGIVPWFSGTVAEQSFTMLEDALLFAVLADGEPWLEYKNSAGITGENAPLDLQGYVEIACTRSDEAMKRFARRLCSELNITIIDEGGFQGVIRYYSGSSTFQSFESLKSELQSAAASPHSWAEFAH